MVITSVIACSFSLATILIRLIFPHTVYEVSGCSVDYVDAVIGADYSVTIELRDRGTKGFLLPKNQILPNSEEVWEGIRYLLENIK